MFSRGYSYRRYRNARSNGTYSSRRSSIRSRSTGNTRAARAQRDSATVVINRIAPFNVYIYGDYYTGSPAGTTFGAIAISHWDELRKSQFFPNYSSMYDQMRLDKTRIKITGSSAVSNNNPYSSPSIILAFDRNGLNSTQYVKLPNSQVPSTKAPVAFPDPNLVSTYSSAQTRQWSSGNSFSMYQTVYPSTIQEKGQYIATGALLAPIEPSTITGNIPDSEFANPCSFWQHQSYPFKPVTLLAVRLPEPVTTQNTYIFNIEFEFTVTFRGMRKPGIAASSKSLQNDLLLTPFSDTVVSNGIVHVTPDEVSSSAKGFSSIDINVQVPQEAVPDPDIQPHTITLTDLNFPKTFKIDAEEPDAPDGWNPIVLNYTPAPNPSPIPITEIDQFDIARYLPGPPISLSSFSSVSIPNTTSTNGLTKFIVPEDHTLFEIIAYYRPGESDIYFYSIDIAYNNSPDSLNFSLTRNTTFDFSYSKQAYYYVTNSIKQRALLSLIASVSGRLITVGSTILPSYSASSVSQEAFSTSEFLIPASTFSFDLAFTPLDTQ